MKNRVLSGVALASVVILASCVQDKDSRQLAPTQPSYSKPSTSSCPAWSTTNTNARSYFALPQDPVLALLDSMQKYYTAGDVATTNSYGYQVLTRLAQAANSPTTLVAGDPTLGSTFANNVLGCMVVDGYSGPIDFAAALGNTGLFAVRSATRDSGVVSRSFDAFGPLFGAERVFAESWYARFGTSEYNGPILFYGFKLPDSAQTALFSGETPAGVLYDLSSLPSPLSFIKITPHTDAPPDSAAALKTGVCNASGGAQILHEHGTLSTILAPIGTAQFCSLSAPPNYGMLKSPFSRLAQVTNRVVDWFAPKPLWAYFLTTIVGVKDLSHLGPVKFNVDPATGITWSQPPKNSKISAQPQSPPIAVKVLSTANNPVQGVKVALTVVGNSGSFTPPADSVRYTDEKGIATFYNFRLDKAGGYVITATTQYGFITYKFMIQNK